MRRAAAYTRTQVCYSRTRVYIGTDVTQREGVQHQGNMSEAGGIAERSVCRVTSLPVVADEWTALSEAVRSEARRLGHPTATCRVEKHFLYTSVLRLCGVGEVDDALVDGCRDVLRRVGLAGKVEVT